jgi:phage-related protein
MIAHLFSRDARIEAGFLLRRLQNGKLWNMPPSRPLPSVGPHHYHHELKVTDHDAVWRIVYQLAPYVMVILEIFSKKADVAEPTADPAQPPCQLAKKNTGGFILANTSVTGKSSGVRRNVQRRLTRSL